MTDRGRVLGLGGVFIKSPDPDRLKAWYRDVLGFALDDYGVNFSLAGQDGYQLWSPFQADTDYFAPSTRDVMLNFRVDDLDALLVRILAWRDAGRCARRALWQVRLAGRSGWHQD